MKNHYVIIIVMLAITGLVNDFTFRNQTQAAQTSPRFCQSEKNLSFRHLYVRLLESVENHKVDLSRGSPDNCALQELMLRIGRLPSSTKIVDGLAPADLEELLRLYQISSNDGKDIRYALVNHVLRDAYKWDLRKNSLTSEFVSRRESQKKKGADIYTQTQFVKPGNKFLAHARRKHADSYRPVPDDIGKLIRDTSTPSAAKVKAPSPAKTVCRPPKKANDADVRRNAAFIISRGLCYKRRNIIDGSLHWHLTIIENPRYLDGTPRWVVPHDDENSAFDTGVRMVAEYGGRLVAVEAGERRYFHGQDPNRAFGSGASCRALRHPWPNYTRVMHHLLTGGPAFFALHSNANGHAGNGGSGHISVQRSSRSMKGFPSSTAKGGLRDEDSMVIIAGLRPSSDPAAKKLIARLNKYGLNVVYEYVRPSGNDCSLSNYLLLNGIVGLGGYFNIEVEHCRTRTQMMMSRKLLSMLGIRRIGRVKDNVPSCYRPHVKLNKALPSSKPSYSKLSRESPRKKTRQPKRRMNFTSGHKQD